jgi:ribosome-associated protein
VFVIASAPSERQVGAIVDEVEDRLRELGSKPVRREGERDGRWVLMDFGDIIVHVQHEEERQYYALERLWKDCPEIDLSQIEAPERPRLAGRAQDADEDAQETEDVEETEDAEA